MPKYPKNTSILSTKGSRRTKYVIKSFNLKNNKYSYDIYYKDNDEWKFSHNNSYSREVIENLDQYEGRTDVKVIFPNKLTSLLNEEHLNG